MKKRLLSALLVAAALCSNTYSAFAYSNTQAPKENGFFKFEEDFDGGADQTVNYTVHTPPTTVSAPFSINGMNKGDAVLSRSDGAKWLVSDFKPKPGGNADSAVHIDLAGKKLYLKGGAEYISILNLDISDLKILDESDASAGTRTDLSLDVSDFKNNGYHEFKFKVNQAGRFRGVGIFPSEDNKNYILFGLGNGQPVEKIGGINGAYAAFIRNGAVTEYHRLSGSYADKEWSISIANGKMNVKLGGDDFVTWNMPEDYDYVENCGYLASMVAAGDETGGYLSKLSYETGNFYTSDRTEPDTAVYYDVIDGIPETTAEDGTKYYIFDNPDIIKKAEIRKYAGTFALGYDNPSPDPLLNGADSIIWDEFSIPDSLTSPVTNSDGYWYQNDGRTYWVNIVNNKSYKYAKKPTTAQNPPVQRIFKLYKNISYDSTIEMEKNKTAKVYIWSGSGWLKPAADNFSITNDRYVKASSGSNYIVLESKKETVMKDKAGEPTILTIENGVSFKIGIKVTGPLTSIIINSDESQVAVYLSDQNAVLADLNTSVVNGGIEAGVINFFTDVSNGATKTLNDLDAIDNADFTEVDNAFARRIISYAQAGEKYENGFFADSFEELEDIFDIFKNELKVGEFNGITLDTGIKTKLTEHEHALDLPIDNRYFRGTADENGNTDTDFTDKICMLLTNKIFENHMDLKNKIDAATLVTVVNNSSNADIIADAIEDYKETMGYVTGVNDSKITEISGDTTKKTIFARMITEQKALDSTAFDSVEKIKSYIDRVSLIENTPTPAPTRAPQGPTGGGGGGGSKGISVIQTPVKPVINQDNTVVDKVQIFSDVPISFWGYDAIRFLNGKGAASGYENGEFKPENLVTKAELIRMLMNVFAPVVEIPEDYVSPFSDVSKDAWFYESIAKANVLGILSGNGTGAEPDKPITKQEMAALIYRMTEVQGKKLFRDADIQKFSDENRIADWAYTPILKMQSAGILVGDEGKLNPTSNASRAVAAQMLYKTVNSFIEEVAIDEE